MNELTQQDDLTTQIEHAAKKVVEMSEARDGRTLDYSEASLSIIEEMLEEASQFSEELTAEQRDTAVEDLGCYVLEVARHMFGGHYAWFEERAQPVLVSGEPEIHVALITWDKVRSRLAGDPTDNISFFFAGYAERVRQAKPGDEVLFT